MTEIQNYYRDSLQKWHILSRHSGMFLAGIQGKRPAVTLKN